MKRAEVISTRDTPGGRQRFAELPIALSNDFIDVFDDRVFRRGERVDGGPAFIAYFCSGGYVVGNDAGEVLNEAMKLRRA